MRVVVLAGGLGTRLAEATGSVPKPMVEVGGRPILWHILKIYAAAGVRHSVIAAGYKNEIIKRYFLEYTRMNSRHLRVETRTGELQHSAESPDDWTVDIVDTGEASNTGGRLGRLVDLLPDEHFCLTYGDGVADVDIAQLLAFHHRHGLMATVTAVRPPARFGGLVLNGHLVSDFTEKPQIGEGWINGGFMVLSRAVLERVTDDSCSLEADVLDPLASEGQMAAFQHDGYWQCMDTLRDVRLLNDLWQEDRAPWKSW